MIAFTQSSTSKQQIAKRASQAKAMSGMDWLSPELVRDEWVSTAIESNNCALFQAAVEPARKQIRQKLIQVFYDSGTRYDQTTELFEDETIVEAFTILRSVPTASLPQAIEDAINVVYASQHLVDGAD